MSLEFAATGDAKTRETANATVPTLCQKDEVGSLAAYQKAPPCHGVQVGVQGLLVQMTLERECGKGEKGDDGHFVLGSVDFIHPENRACSIQSGS